MWLQHDYMRATLARAGREFAAYSIESLDRNIEDNGFQLCRVWHWSPDVCEKKSASSTQWVQRRCPRVFCQCCCSWVLFCWWPYRSTLRVSLRVSLHLLCQSRKGSQTSCCPPSFARETPNQSTSGSYANPLLESIRWSRWWFFSGVIDCTAIGTAHIIFTFLLSLLNISYSVYPICYHDRSLVHYNPWCPGV